jgi:hypothetical protein
MDAIMKILDRFERWAIEDITIDNKLGADNYDSVSKYRLIMKIKKAIGMAFRKDRHKSGYSLDDILKPGKLWD